jgi:hypothetical protein
MGEFGVVLQDGKAVQLQIHVIVVVEDVQANNGVPLGEQLPGKMETDESSGSSDEYFHECTLLKVGGVGLLLQGRNKCKSLLRG